MAKVNQKTVQLENFLREKIREVVAEELTRLNEWDPEEWDERGDHGPAHGERMVDRETGEPMVYDERNNRWISEEEWADMADPEYDASGVPMPELTPEDPDPHPGHLDLNTLLNLEFDEHKQIQMETLERIIKESVRRFLKTQDKK